MSAVQQELLNAVFRWVHVVAGVLWLGHIYFFNLVQAHVANRWSVVSRQDVAPLLLPRAHFWMRWGSVVTIGSGLLLLGVVYQVGGLMIDHDTHQEVSFATAAGLIAMAVTYFVYDAVWTSKLARRSRLASALSVAVLVALTFGLSLTMSSRALYLHLGAVLAVVMAMNVWRRIWPAQKLLLAELEANPDQTSVAASEAATRMAQRSRHNIYLSLPVTFFMVSNHFPSIYTHSFGPGFAVIATLVGFAMAYGLVRKSASESLTSF